ncbi:anthranilate synthase component I [Bacillus massilinigeriensis]|uniref:anthranilate synthase component I n=1 Tax=Bacillus massilionigeriensis TaxID=1805475 RepID=UPI00096B3156|nr:anthranilate synthase component I [Bacillus massilionigeriensis]
MGRSTYEKKALVEELQGDTLTPISIFQRLKGKKFLLESSLKHENTGRYSFIGVNPTFELKGINGKTEILKAQGKEILDEKPLEVLKKKIPVNTELCDINLPFIGGAVGYVSYDVIRDYEYIGEVPIDELGVPDVHFMMFEDVVVFDHLEEKVYLVAVPFNETTTIEQLAERLLERKAEILSIDPLEAPPFTISSYEASIKRGDYIKMVEKAKEHILEGDIFQIVLSQRMNADFQGDPFSFYRNLRVKNPTPYMYYLDFHDYVIAGFSPESLIKGNMEKIITNPIAGTRPRGKTQQEDQHFEIELLQDEKELAEHRMLVDLGRNDIGRVSDFGSVKVEKYMEIEKYKHVMHIVSEVSGRLKDSLSPIDALISCLPAGTVSGAPKIRAMEIINELEDKKRGVYSGAIGYYSINGNMDFALAIRTALIKDQKAFIQGGAGIVYDSLPEKEYEETLHKLKTFLEV